MMNRLTRFTLLLLLLPLLSLSLSAHAEARFTRDPGHESAITARITPPTPNQNLPIISAKEQLKDAFSDWHQAWSGKDVFTYVHSYAPSYRPDDKTTHEKWISSRMLKIVDKRDIRLEISNLQISLLDTNHAKTTFYQKYTSNIYRDAVVKTLNWELIDGKWLIVNEIAGVAE